MTYCPYCGAMTSPDDKECPQCHKCIEIEHPDTMYCRECGEQIPKSSEFCPFCGQKVMPVKDDSKNKSEQKPKEEKSEILAIILSIFITGLGTMYAGYLKEGLILLALQIVFAILWMFVPIIPFIASFVLWIYGIIDAVKKVDQTNKALKDGDSC